MEEPTFTPLTDGTVTLQRPTEADAESIATLVRSSYPYITPWMTWAKPDHAIADALVWINRETDPTCHPFLILDSELNTIGSCGLSRLDESNLIAEVGYWLAPEGSGSGYATRATNLLLRYAIEEVGVHRAELWISAENEPSRRVAERSFARFESTARQAMRIAGRNHDAHCYAFVKGDSLDPIHDA